MACRVRQGRLTDRRACVWCSSLRVRPVKKPWTRWVSWARRCRIPAFVDLQKRIVRHRKTIDATLDHGLSNGLIESTNTKIRVLTRMASGFTKPEALVALAMLALGGYCPPLPGRGTPK
jgi:transposase